MANQPSHPLAANVSPAAFAGVAEDYARYRPPYPDALIEHLIARLPRKERLLDLACGPGRVALQCAAAFDEVWAIDLEPGMVAKGKELAAERGIANIRWLVGPAEELEAPADSFDLVTAGEAFHRLDQHRVLRLARSWLRPGGWFASLGSAGILQGSEPWQLRLTGLAREWTRQAFPGGWASARPGSVSGPAAEAEAMRAAGFEAVSSETFALPHVWSVDEVLGYLRSTSVCSRAVLGHRHEAFEGAARSALLDLHPDGMLSETLEFGYTAGRRGAG